MTKQLQLTDGCLIVSGSMLQTIKRCPTYARWKYIEQRERTGGIAKGRAPGKTWHLALEAYYKSRCAGASVETAEAAAKAALDQAYKTVELVEGDEHLNLMRMQEVLKSYLHGCRFEMGKGGKNGIYSHPGYADEPFDVLGTETVFAVHLGDVQVSRGYPLVTVIYLGYTDLITRWRERGETLCIDTKTMRRWGQEKVVEWRMASQPMGYAACVPQYLREGLDQLPKTLQESLAPYETQRKALAKQVERIDGFCLNAVVIRASEDLTKCKNPPLEMHREVFYYQDQQLVEWREDALLWCKTWLEWCACGTWPRVDTECASYFGRICPFEVVCSMPPNQRELTLSTDLFQNVKRGWVKKESEAANGESAGGGD